jgi:hypothetical protein
MAEQTTEGRPGVEDGALLVSALFDRVFGQLAEWREAIAAGPAETTTARLDELVAGLVLPSLTADDAILIGAGFIAAPDYVHGRDVHFAWWLGPLQDNPLMGTTYGPTKLDLSTRGYADYLRDFRSLEWYSIPETTHQTHITGPYVDHLCTCDYIVTLTMPTEIDGTMIGVVGADIYVKRLEQELLPTLLAIEKPVTLVNEQRRVMVSTDPTLAVGTLLPAHPDPAGVGRYQLLPCAGTPFALAIETDPS